MRILPGPVSAMKISPLAATRMARGFSSPVTYGSTANPLGTAGRTPIGAATTLGVLLAEDVAYGLGKSAAVINRRTPGPSWCQSSGVTWADSPVVAKVDIGSDSAKASARPKHDNFI